MLKINIGLLGIFSDSLLLKEFTKKLELEVENYHCTVSLLCFVNSMHPVGVATINRVYCEPNIKNSDILILGISKCDFEIIKTNITYYLSKIESNGFKTPKNIYIFSPCDKNELSFNMKRFFPKKHFDIMRCHTIKDDFLQYQSDESFINERRSQFVSEIYS